MEEKRITENDNIFDLETDNELAQILDPVLNSDSNVVVQLADIKQNGQIVNKIRVVIVRVYPNEYCGIDRNDQKFALNKWQMETLRSNENAKIIVAEPSHLENVGTKLTLSNEYYETVRVVDVAAYNANDWAKSAVIKILHDDLLKTLNFKEGEMVEFTKLLATQDDIPLKEFNDAEKRLYSTTDTKPTRFGNDDLVPGNLGRCLTGFTFINGPNFQPLFGEIDCIGVVIEITKNPSLYGQQVRLLGQDGETLWIQFPYFIKGYGVEDLIAVGKIIGFNNLSRIKNELYPTNRTEFHLEPNTGMFENLCEEIKNIYERFKARPNGI